MPNDVRVLVNTPRNVSINIRCIGNGQYVHFGLISGLKRSIIMYSEFIKTNEIKLNINITYIFDGLPISKSSGSQFWPIMAPIEGIDIYTSPFLIDVYLGMFKPNDANDFLRSFVNEFIFSLKMA